MKHLALLVTFWLISLNSYADTLDYWHVYLNDSLIAQFNAVSNNPTIRLNQAELKASDTLTVRYGTDHPCINCYYKLTVFVEIMEKLPEATTKENFGKLSIPLKRLYDIQRRHDIHSFHFNYEVDGDHQLDTSHTYLFKLKLL